MKKKNTTHLGIKTAVCSHIKWQDPFKLFVGTTLGDSFFPSAHDNYAFPETWHLQAGFQVQQKPCTSEV